MDLVHRADHALRRPGESDAAWAQRNALEELRVLQQVHPGWHALHDSFRSTEPLTHKPTEHDLHMARLYMEAHGPAVERNLEEQRPRGNMGSMQAGERLRHRQQLRDHEQRVSDARRQVEAKHAGLQRMEAAVSVD